MSVPRSALTIGIACALGAAPVTAFSQSESQSKTQSKPPAPSSSPFGTVIPAPGLDTAGVRIPPATPDPKTQLDVPEPGVTDRSGLESPVPPAQRGVTVPVGAVLHVTMTQAISSGTALNGAPVYGVLQMPVRTASGTVLQAGTRVLGTVVSSAPAGRIQSGGVLSIQLTHVGPAAVVTDVRDFNGQQGHKDVADSAPAKGGEAKIAAGAQLQFRVMEVGNVPGILPGIAPAKNAGGGGQSDGNPNGGQETQGQSSGGVVRGHGIPPGQQAAPAALPGVAPPASSTPTGQPK